MYTTTLSSYRWYVFLALLLISGLPILNGCGDGQKVTMTHLPLIYKPTQTHFTLANGWTISLDKALISIEAVRFHELKEKSVSSVWQWLRPLSPIKLAWAHPGHYNSGLIKAECITAQKVDLIAKQATHLGIVQGYTGAYDSVTLTFGLLGAFVLEGEATKGTQRIPFKIDIDLEEKELGGIHFTYTLTAQDKNLELQMDLPRWFARIDFKTFRKIPGNTYNIPDEDALIVLQQATLSAVMYTITPTQ